MKKYVICIPASDDFALATAVLIFSLKKNLSVFSECDVKVVYNNLNNQSKNLIRKSYEDTIFEKPVDPSFYKHVPKTIYGEDNYDVYLSFETFSQVGYERCIYLDADMLCINDFSNMVQHEKSIVWKYPNLGILIVGEKYLTGETYRQMIDLVLNTHIKNDPMGDQTTCQHLFNPSNPDVKVISELYNFQHFGAGGKGSPEQYNAAQEKIKIIHYSGRRKPWGPVWDGDDKNKNCIRYTSLMNENGAVKIWYEYYDKFREQRL
jgi:lipopolysaccharide biosynthesis glycosyltransferase